MKKFKTYAFWVALSGAIVILVQSLGKLFGFEIESSTIENVIMSICGVLVVLGIVTKTSSETSTNNTSDETHGAENNTESVEKTNNENDTTLEN